MGTAPTVDELVLAYRKIRDAKSEVDDKYKQEVKELNAQLDAISSRLLEICNEQNVDGFKASTGSVSRKTVTRYWTSDWESMYNFVREHDAFYLLEQRLHSANVKDFLEENPDLMPMGLNSDTKYTVVVRKPANR